MPRIDLEVHVLKPGTGIEPPRQMVLEDRRLIFAKLEEVYVDERTGYCADWNDARVGIDMNVPRKWSRKSAKPTSGQNAWPIQGAAGAGVELNEPLVAAKAHRNMIMNIVNQHQRVAKQIEDARVQLDKTLRDLGTLSGNIGTLTGRQAHEHFSPCIGHPIDPAHPEAIPVRPVSRWGAAMLRLSLSRTSWRGLELPT
ncbi:hypothetical protein PSQ90_14815 [Devosia rhodophyticola]|uniref:Uncharacterized protein n=1 Tax=Devosia rhodophyticola TaxID=3026423 RepID=A0ABY7YWX9_9HYPH|nr:hypothetical protein [Devosia rhodophyticola]WDR05530.1 hypothetical protein PSQ90_14815 [Devosia rhodophyticola]